MVTLQGIRGCLGKHLAFCTPPLHKTAETVFCFFNCLILRSFLAKIQAWSQVQRPYSHPGVGEGEFLCERKNKSLYHWVKVEIGQKSNTWKLEKELKHKSEGEEGKRRRESILFFPTDISYYYCFSDHLKETVIYLFIYRKEVENKVKFCNYLEALISWFPVLTLLKTFRFQWHDMTSWEHQPSILTSPSEVHRTLAFSQSHQVKSNSQDRTKQNFLNPLQKNKPICHLAAAVSGHLSTIPSCVQVFLYGPWMRHLSPYASIFQMQNGENTFMLPCTHIIYMYTCGLSDYSQKNALQHFSWIHLQKI